MSGLYSSGGKLLFSGGGLAFSGGGGGGGSGFTPASGVTYSGTFANGQSMTVNLPAGGLGSRANPLPYLYFPLETNFSTHPTLSRNSYTFSGLSGGSNPTIQTSVKPVNAAGAVSWIPLRNGSSSGFSTCFVDQPYWSLVSPTYTFVKRCQAFNPDGSPGGNIKPWRAWRSAMDNSQYHGSVNEAFAANDPTENTTGLTGGQRVNGGMPRVPSTWYTDEVWFQESTTNNIDGIWNWARQAIFNFDYGGRWENGTTALPGPYSEYYLDEATFETGFAPNGTTDTAYLGPVIVDDSWLILVITDEGSTYQTMRRGNGGTDSQREYQCQTSRSDTSITFTVNQGSHASLTGKNLLALTGYGTAINLGVGS